MKELATSELIQILGPDGVIKGTGFLISAERAVTCTHVLAPIGSPVPKEASICFYGNKTPHKVVVEPRHCRPAEAEDILFLKLVAPVPHKVPLPLGSSNGTNGHEFETFGFPTANADGGIRGDGHVLGKTTINNIQVLQIDSKQVTPGFSGAPVMDKLTGRVIGMVTKIAATDEYGRLRDVAFITPSEQLRTVFSELQIEDACPYRGLSSFTSDPDDVKFFYGRERLTSDLVARLRRNPNFLAIVGPSGSGKSSVLNAGVVPAIRAGDAGFVPDKLSVFALSKVPVGDVLAAAIALQSAGEERPHARRTVFVLDELEQFFVASSNAKEVAVPLLARLVKHRPGFTLVTAFRSDFYDPVFTSSLGPCLDDGQVNVRLMSLDELKTAIATPATSVGLRFSEGLVEDIAADAAKLDNPLPLLEFALTRLWEQRNDGELTRDAYRQMNGVAGSIAFWASDAFARLSEEERNTTQRILLRLIHYGDGNTPDTRKRAALANLVSDSQDQTQVLGVVMNLATSRILTTDRDPSTKQQTVGLIHDALITQWEQLAGWIKERRQFLEWRQRLATRIEEWQKSARDDSGLLRGYALNDAARWLSERREDLNEAERGFVGASIERQSRLEDEKRKEERRQLKRTRKFAIFVSIAFLLALAATVVAWIQQQTARQQEEAANQLYYDSNMNLAQEAYLSGSYERVYDLLTPFLPSSRKPKLSETRDFFWYFLWRLAQQDTLSGHANGVTSVAFSPDGKTLASASFDKTIRVWDVASHQSIAVLGGLNDAAWFITYSPDGKILASSNRDGMIDFWDVMTRQKLVEWKAQDGGVWSLAFAPDSKTLASAGGDGTIKLWNVSTHQELSSIRAHNGMVWSVAFAPGGKILASGGRDKTLKLWDIETHHSLATFGVYEEEVISVAFSPDGKTLATGGGSDFGKATIKLWDVASRQELATWIGPQRLIYSVAFSPDGKTLASSSFDLPIELWDVASRQELASLAGHQRIVQSIAFSPDGRTLASGSEDSTVKLWDMSARQSLAILKGHQKRVLSVAFSSDQRTLASVSEDNRLKLWDVTARREVYTLEGGAWSVAFSPDGKMLASASNDGTVNLWDIVTHRNLAMLRHEELVRSIAFAPDGKTIASGGGGFGNDGTITLWNVDTHQASAHFTGHKELVWSIAFAPDGKILASGSADKTIRLWDVATGQNLTTLNGHEDAVLAVAFSPNGKTIASAGLDKTIRLWDVATGQTLATLKVQDESINALAFSPDGKTLASAGDEFFADKGRSVTLWDTATHQTLATLKSHKENIYSLAFAPDGKTLASAGGESATGNDFAIRLWFASTDGQAAREPNK